MTLMGLQCRWIFRGLFWQRPARGGILYWKQPESTWPSCVLRRHHLSTLYSAGSILEKYGLNANFFKEYRLTIHDNASSVFSKRLVSKEREIRLLFIIPNDSPSSAVELLMAHCSLDEAPPYLALSYTGGNPYPSDQWKRKKLENVKNPYLQMTNVLVNGIEFPVKRNLLEALYRFRKTHAMKPFWIDSICINEADPVERTEQVRLMGEVYGRAQDVPIWLGEVSSKPRTRMALQLVKGMLNAFISWYDANHTVGFRKRWDQIIRRADTTPDAIDQKLFWNFLQRECQPFFDRIDLKSLGIRDDARAWEALRNLLSRRWFDRVWTWQEKELARSATVYIGDEIIPWAELRFSMLLVMAHDLSNTRVTPFQVMPGRQYLHVLDSLNIGHSPDLLDIVINVRHRNTQLRRDKIFGVLGAAGAYKNKPSDDVEHFSRLVNYGYLTTQDLYKEFSRYWIKEKRDLRVLQACNPSKKKIPELPSWVVDWSDITPSHQLSSRLYNAAEGTQVDAEYHYHINSDEIQLGGIPIDTIKFVCHDKDIDMIEEKRINESAFWDPYRERLLRPLVSMYLCGLGVKQMSLLKGDWLQTARHIDWDKPYTPTGQSMKEAFWRTLLCDQNPLITNVTDQRISLDTDISEVFNRWAHRKGLTRSLLPEELRDRRPVELYEKRWRESLESGITHKRFFVTEMGLIGLAPRNIQAGDLVCVLLGGRVPFSLRENDDHYNLVEETYLHGFMDGRAVDLANRGELEVQKFRLR
ncbi:hypothetical protein K469DRAFT_718680 [Zopfia rhizophila CBS 207.26]|uniref:Heterokaryon incompatibility domain-containing protein n=1 Tax=Zopfia rhizophila CBS 207.26 TaxID=1314779 RepID=A0A6A6ELR3_9PEZI|nr:hypothetical protein K469DRAFT_718680 [Zopfia rhizophila CBS 207.26]